MSKWRSYKLQSTMSFEQSLVFDCTCAKRDGIITWMSSGWELLARMSGDQVGRDLSHNMFSFGPIYFQ